MGKIITGRVLKYGNNINTDIISPPQYMELPIAEAAKFAMRAVDSAFSAKAETNHVFVAGSNLGSGSSRETSPLTLKYLGFEAIVAVFFARIFYRNCINLGIPAIECAEANKIENDDEVEIDIANGKILNKSKDETYECSRLPDHIFELIERGGLVSYLKEQKTQE